MGTVNPAQIKKLKLTAELVARVERIEPDPGPEPGTADPTDAEFDAMVGALLLEYKPKELWIFAYGSLIWNPEFEFLESRGATASGWHRSFASNSHAGVERANCPPLCLPSTAAEAAKA